MKETKFKTLMHCGAYIDPNLLHSGIYIFTKPFIFDRYTTIESLINESLELQKHFDLTNTYFNEKYYESLKQCELVEITIDFK